jgi:hypothetical protein
MYSDLLDVLGNHSSAGAGAGASSSHNQPLDDTKYVVASFQAGKMDLTMKPVRFLEHGF